jgi:glycerol uptake facilitator-like aquaporin
VLLVFGGRIQDFEAANGLVRGSAGSELSAMAFGQYFPNPAVYDTGADARAMVSPLLAVSVEGLGTALLLLVVFALGDERWAARVSNAAPLLVGATVAVLIYLFAPLTQAGWNPARDLGPRLVAWMAGWGAIAIPGPAGGFWVYVTGPVAGGLLGAVGYHVLFRKGHAAPP